MKVLNIGIFTLVETVGLVAWLLLVHHHLAAAGVVVLALLLTVEHAFSYNTNHHQPLLSVIPGKAGIPLLRIAIFSVTETVFWALWLVIAQRSGYVAAVVLAATLVAQHNVEFNVQEGRPFLTGLLRPRSIVISVIEAAGAYLWLRSRNPGFLFALLFVEHLIQAAEIRKTVASNATARA